jgi:aspartate/methionine/tyrosine aminotransferase
MSISQLARSIEAFTNAQDERWKPVCSAKGEPSSTWASVNPIQAPISALLASAAKLNTARSSMPYQRIPSLKKAIVRYTEELRPVGQRGKRDRLGEPSSHLQPAALHRRPAGRSRPPGPYWVSYPEMSNWPTVTPWSSPPRMQLPAHMAKSSARSARIPRPSSSTAPNNPSGVVYSEAFGRQHG